MSVLEPNQRAQKLFDSVVDHFEQIYTRAVPKALEDLRLFDAFRNAAPSISDDATTGGATITLTDRMINLVFKDHVLLRAAKQKRKWKFDDSGKRVENKRNSLLNAAAAANSEVKEEEEDDDDDDDDDEDENNVGDDDDDGDDGDDDKKHKDGDFIKVDNRHSDTTEVEDEDEADADGGASDDDADDGASDDDDDADAADDDADDSDHNGDDNAEVTMPVEMRDTSLTVSTGGGAGSGGSEPIRQGWQSNGRAFFFVRSYKWSQSNVGELLRRAKTHNAYLRRLRSRTWAKLNGTERLKIDEYMRGLVEWVRRIQSRIDETEFMAKAVPMVMEIDRLYTDSVAEHKAVHSLDRTVTIERKPKRIMAAKSLPLKRVRLDTPSSATKLNQPPPPPPPQPMTTTVVTATATTNMSNAIAITRSSRDERMGKLLEELNELVDYTLSLYGNVRGSGSVVEHAVVPSGGRQCAPSASSAASAPSSSSSSSLVAKKRVESVPNNNEFHCIACNVARLIDLRESVASCPKCGDCVRFHGVGTSNCAFEDTPDMEYTKRKNYEPKNYATLWLRRVQGRLNMDMPESVYKVVFDELFCRRLRQATRKNVREALQKHGLTEYYPMVPLIVYKFNDVPLPDFSDEEEVILSKMYDLAYDAYLHCPQHIKQRSSYISVPYHYYQCVTIQGWMHYRKCFPLIDRRNLRKHDRIWKWMCDYIGWPFYPTH